VSGSKVKRKTLRMTLRQVHGSNGSEKQRVAPKGRWRRNSRQEVCLRRSSWNGRTTPYPPIAAPAVRPVICANCLLPAGCARGGSPLCEGRCCLPAVAGPASSPVAAASARTRARARTTRRWVRAKMTVVAAVAASRLRRAWACVAAWRVENKANEHGRCAPERDERHKDNKRRAGTTTSFEVSALLAIPSPFLFRLPRGAVSQRAATAHTSPRRTAQWSVPPFSPQRRHPLLTPAPPPFFPLPSFVLPSPVVVFFRALLPVPVERPSDQFRRSTAQHSTEKQSTEGHEGGGRQRCVRAYAAPSWAQEHVRLPALPRPLLLGFCADLTPIRFCCT
jgi:hypothetical protein